MTPLPDTDDSRPLAAEKLSEAERTVLDLLARGHTAKSIATLTGRSVGAVNERLRDARRKTGSASSRELARRLHAQENRDEKIGVAAPQLEAAPGHAAAVNPRPPLATAKGPIIMATILSAAVLSTFAFVQSQPPVGGDHAPLTAASPVVARPGDPASLAVGENTPYPGELYALVRSEARDPAWAPRTEAALRARFGAVRYVDGAGNPLRVLCATSVCEVSGLLPSDIGQHQINFSMEQLQGRALTDVQSYGLVSGSASFRSTKTVPSQIAFAIYFRRKAA